APRPSLTVANSAVISVIKTPWPAASFISALISFLSCSTSFMASSLVDSSGCSLIGWNRMESDACGYSAHREWSGLIVGGKSSVPALDHCEGALPAAHEPHWF